MTTGPIGWFACSGTILFEVFMSARGMIRVALLASLALSGCGGSELTMTEYVDAVDAIFAQGISRYEVLVESPEGGVLIAGQGEHFGFDGEGAQLTDFTPQDLHVVLEQLAEIQDEALEAAHDIDPPEQLEELHELYFRELPIADLAARAGTATDWYELSDSPEMAAYRTSLAADNAVCVDFQAKLDATNASGAFADAPWMPTRLTEIVDYALGCTDLPSNPEDAYRPPPAGS
ncbi:MAG: hypothetical protein ACR2OI_04575 [Acidimicrobiia bacterium]